MKLKALMIVALLAGCSTVTPYGPRSGGNLGYRDWKVGPSSYKVTVEAHGGIYVLCKYFFRRAGELCLGAGFKAYYLDPEADCPSTREWAYSVEGAVTCTNDEGATQIKVADAGIPPATATTQP